MKVKHLFPVICVSVIIMVISCAFYYQIMSHETEECWDTLSSSAENVTKRIRMKFDDEIVKLHMVEKMLLEEMDFSEEKIKSLHLETFQPTTIFSRIDVLYPNNVILSSENTQIVYETVSFEELAKKGEHMSARRTDFFIGKECIYYNIPLKNEEEIFAILVGVIDANSLLDVFQPTIYKGQVNYCIVDSKDGNFIMDSWHEELGNAYEMEQRPLVKQYETVDLKEEIKNLTTGVIAFQSNTTGNNLYMYFMPLGIFDWQLEIFIEEGIIFRNLFYYKQLLSLVGIVEVLLLVLYFLWNIRIVNQLEKQNAKIHKQKEQLQYISYRDILTGLYNRNKYIECMQTYQEQKLYQIGVVYLDLNGLKQINDTQSHEAGDEYICEAAQSILKVFEDNGYRIGGDEFVVLTMDMPQEKFEEKIELLKDFLQKGKVSVSLGIVWEEVCDDFDAMLKKAEKQMYQKKENYYLSHERYRNRNQKSEI